MAAHKKDFDCVALKNEIQQKLALEHAGMSEDEIRVYTLNKLENSKSPIGNLWRAIQERQELEYQKQHQKDHQNSLNH